MRHKILFFLVTLSSFALFAYPQDTIKQDPEILIVEGDTLPSVEMRAVVIFPEMVFKSKREVTRYSKLVNNVRKVYPYAKLVAQKLTYYRSVIDTIPQEKARKQYMKMAEKELEREFGDEVRDLTFSQGKILIKLVYRETGNSTFDIVKELRGGFTAFIWQTMATLFGYNLRTVYDPGGDDQAIEQIVLMIEAGAL